MADLKTLLERLGYVGPQTLLQSGNVVFGFPPNAKSRTAADIEAHIEAELQKALDLASDVFVRSSAEWGDLIAANPFPNEAKSDPAHLVAVILRDPPDPSSVKALQATIKGRETVRAHDRQLYIVYPDGIGTSKLTGTVIERVLGTRGTARNWNTVLKLSALAGA
jgi:uncharacterized protein (DUF1697 family)